jgi:hypothetical protein
MMSWKKRQWNWKAGWNAIRKGLVKSRSGLQSRNSANQRFNAKNAKVFAKDAEEIFFATFAGTFAFFAFKSCLHFTTYCLLPSAFRTHAFPYGQATAQKPNRFASNSTISVTPTGAVAFAHAAAESASMGRGDVISRVAV